MWQIQKSITHGVILSMKDYCCFAIFMVSLGMTYGTVQPILQQLKKMVKCSANMGIGCVLWVGVHAHPLGVIRQDHHEQPMGGVTLRMEMVVILEYHRGKEHHRRRQRDTKENR